MKLWLKATSKIFQILRGKMKDDVSEPLVFFDLIYFLPKLYQSVFLLMYNSAELCSHFLPAVDVVSGWVLTA